MQDPRDKKQSGYVTYKGETGFVADLSTIPENMKNSLQVQPI